LKLGITSEITSILGRKNARKFSETRKDSEEAKKNKGSLLDNPNETIFGSFATGVTRVGSIVGS